MPNGNAENGFIAYTTSGPGATRCVQCHTKGGVGPFALSNYKKVKGWSDMIAEVVLTRQMPPWHADPAIGSFVNDCGLEPHEAHTLVKWVEADCPRGEGADDLAPVITRDLHAFQRPTDRRLDLLQAHFIDQDVERMPHLHPRLVFQSNGV